ncbi:MAG: hypothetical protein EPN94_07875 [Nitrospirae bacterium]|nr:MAG: hypothetical protein EPN94_07875 [Nitrospirota bacterium]
MTYSDAIKNGFRLVHKNWQLVLVQLAMMVISCIGFFVFIGIPLAVAFVMFGLDLTELTRLKDLIGTMREPSEIISRYMGLLIVFLISFLIYLLFIASIGIYVFGGSAGLIGRMVRDNTAGFNMNIFFSEGKRLFFPLVGFTTIIGLIFIGVAFVLGLFGGGIAAIISIAKEHEATLALFLGIFFSLLLFCVGLVLIVCALALTLYGVASIVFKGSGPLKATKETIKYLYHHLDALWLYCIAFAGYILASFLLILLGTPFSLIPIAGPILALPYQLFSYTVQSYLGLVIICTIFIYYFSTEIRAEQATELQVEPVAEWVTQMPDTSQPQVSEPTPPQPEKEGPE